MKPIIFIIKTRAENTVREQKIRIDALNQEQHRISNEHEKTQEHRTVLDKQAQRYIIENLI